MRILIDSKITVWDPTPEVRAYAKGLSFPNPQYAKAQSMGKWTGNIPRTIDACFERGDAIAFPFGAIDGLWARLPKGERAFVETDFGPMPRAETLRGHASLYPYQEKAVRSMLEAKHGILVAPCGAGKTQMGLELARRTGMRTLWITHTEKLLRQSKERAESIYEGDFGTITAGKARIGGDVTFATIQTLSRMDPSEYAEAFGCVIVDECHHCVGTPLQATMFSKVMAWIKCRYRYGLTATERRQDGLTPLMHAILGPTRHEVSKAEVGDKVVKARRVELHWAKAYRPEDYCAPDGTLDFNALTEALCADDGRNAYVAKMAEEAVGEGRNVLILTSRVSHADGLASRIDGAVAVHGRIKEKDRDYGARCLVATYALAKEGLDIPRLDTLILATPIKDEIAIRQSVGRIERKAEGKAEPIAYDIVDDGIPYCKAAARKRKRILG